MNRRRFGNAFTLIELIMVIAIVGILSASSAAIINGPVKQKQAKEAVVSANINKLSNAISMFRTSEGRFPTGTNSSTIESAFSTYAAWPDDSPPGYTYTYGVVGTGFVVVSTNPSYTGCIKFSSTWTGSPRSCSTNCLTSSVGC